MGRSRTMSERNEEKKTNALISSDKVYKGERGDVLLPEKLGELPPPQLAKLRTQKERPGTF